MESPIQSESLIGTSGYLHIFVKGLRAGLTL